MSRSLLFLPLILGVLSLFMWHKVYFHFLLGESLTYFIEGYEQIKGMTYPGIEGIFRYDIFARITFTSFETLFKDNLLPFNIFLLAILVSLTIAYYFMILKLTEKKIIAGMASVFFGLNFVFLAEMVGFGFFQWIYERVPNFIFSFISFFFFVTYLRRNNYRFYFLSLGFFTLSILAAHFSLFSLPFFIFYSLFFTLFDKKERKKLKRRVLDLLPFILVAYVLVTTKPSVPPTPRGKTLTETLTDKDLISDIFYQLTMVTIPLQILEYLNAHFDIRSVVPKLYIPVGLFYVSVTLFFLRVKKLWGVILIASFFSLIAISILNLHVHKISVVNWRPYLTNHYFMTLGFFVPIYWSILLYYIGTKHKVLTIAVFLFTVHWTYLNIQTYWKYDDMYAYNHRLNHNMRNFVKNNYTTFKDQSMVIFPVYIEDFVVDFYEKYYKKPSVTYKSIYRLSREDSEKFDPKRDKIFDFAEDKYTIVDKTVEYRKIFAEKTSWD